MPIPSLQLQKKPVICRVTEGLVAELWSPRFVTIQWLCSQLCYETAANQRTIVEIELLAPVSWKWGCRPFSCRCSQNVRHCRKEICSTCLFKESIPSIPGGNSKHPSLPEAWGSWEPQHAPPALRYSCIMPIPSLQLQKKLVICSSRGFWSRSCGLQDLLQYSDCALSCAMRLLQKVKNRRDWAFRNSELEMGLPALQLPMFTKCEALPKRDLFHMFV